MRLDRAEWNGTAQSVAFHVALIAAMSLSLAKVARAPEPPAIAVEFVDDIGLNSAAPQQEVAEAQQAVSPDPAPIEEAVPPPKIEPALSPRKSDVAPPRTQPPRNAPPRQSRLGDDFLDGVAQGNSRTGTAPRAAPAAPTFDAAAMAGIEQAIRRQVQPCADRQVLPGPEAKRLRVYLNIRLAPDGRLSRPPEVTRIEGRNAETERFVERVKDMAVATYVGCAPIRGLPPELYRTPQGGWSFIEMTYRP